MPEYAHYIDGIVHKPTQTAGTGFDLTVAEIYEVTEPGHVDFGGGELEAAAVEPCECEKRSSDDEYGWWSLGSGTHLVEYNESISRADLRFTVQTRDALLERGAFHPTLHVVSLPRVPLSVDGTGIRIKENARVSTIIDADPA